MIMSMLQEESLMMMRRVKRGRGTPSVELAEVLHCLLCAQIWSLQQRDEYCRSN